MEENSKKEFFMTTAPWKSLIFFLSVESLVNYTLEVKVDFGSLGFHNK